MILVQPVPCPDRAGFTDYFDGKRTGQFDSDTRALWLYRAPSYFWSVDLQCWLMVPAGFVTNFASIPRWPVVYLMYADKCWEEPGLHDLGYTLRGILVTAPLPGGGWAQPVLRPMTREAIDRLFRESLLANPKIDTGTAETMYAAVRLGGESSWQADTTVQQPDFIQRMILPVEPRQVHDSSMIEAA